MALRVTHFYELGDQGWTEQFYDPSTDITTPVDYQAADIQVWLAPRARGVIFRAVRWSDINNPRASRLQVLNAAAPPTALEPDVTGAAAVCQIASGDLVYRRHLWLRGLPDAYVARTDDGNDVPDPRLLTAIANIGVWLNRRSYYIYAKNTAAAPYRPIVQVIDGGLNSFQTIIEIRVADPLPNPGDLVEFKGISQDDLPGLRGIFKVLPGVGQQFKITYRYRNDLSPLFIPNANWRLALYKLVLIERIQFERFNTRTTGRPISRSRGRRGRQIRRL